MEYFFAGVGLIYILKKKKKLSFLYENKIYKNIKRKIEYNNKEQEKMSYLQSRQSESLYHNQSSVYKVYDETFPVINFKSFADTRHLVLKTDTELYGGDTTLQVNYNVLEDAAVFEGIFEMKNRHLIEYGKMLSRISFDVPSLPYHKGNVIRVCCKTNGVVIRILLGVQHHVFNCVTYQAHIIDKSNEFQTYELPLENFRFYDEHRRHMNNFLKPKDMTLKFIDFDLESKDEGAYKVELKRVDICFDHKAIDGYKKYKLPIFLKI